jgi:peroxiredoxin
MHPKKILPMVVWGVPLLLGLMLGNAGAQLKVGEEAPSFQLPSTRDELVDYYRDYYGKRHLVMTFFPAAFTPV